ncbi:50S ribosomal protein L24 [Candidatus Woesearchaeota archaeon]|nr:50S ribosomal protein L24 [Candidatus Woesearchaeota archaeon]
MKQFSTQWKSSSKARKQRKYVFQAPLHIRKKFLSCHLADDLHKKLKKRNLPLRKDDKVKVMRGSYAGKEGKVVGINTKDQRVSVENVERIKRDGSKALVGIHVSNLMITQLHEEKKRLA